MKLQFLGATQTVTGSRYLLTVGKKKILVDCGLFQGFKNLRLKNWDAFPVPASDIDAVILTHAHLDHSGYIPLLVKNGFHGKVFCTTATRDLCSLLLPDSGFLQEEEARFANKRGFSKHTPALALYTQKEAEASLNAFHPVPWRERVELGAGLEFELHPAGHLFGAASVLIRAEGKTIAFSGDLGRKSDPITQNPSFEAGADYLVVESTYGNRQHLDEDPEEQLRIAIMTTYERKGTLLIPSFAVGRAQLLLHYIHELKKRGAIPNIPVFLNSPMANKANGIFIKHASESKISAEQARDICATAKAVASVEESKELNERKDPVIIIAASGMATGGRVLHHIKAFAPDEKNTILFAGFQAGGTRGDVMSRGAKEVKIHGEYWPVRARVEKLDSMSAHADADEILAWVDSLKKKPRRIFVTHGEPEAADTLRLRLTEKFRIDAVMPEYGQTFELT